MQSAGCREQGAECRVQGAGSRVQGALGKASEAPTFGSFQVPDADGARLGASHNELLGGVEADTLHWGRVTRQALWREGSSFSALRGQTPSCCPKLLDPRKCVSEKWLKRRTAEQLLLRPQLPELNVGQTPSHSNHPCHFSLCPRQTPPAEMALGPLGAGS